MTMGQRQVCTLFSPSASPRKGLFCSVVPLNVFSCLLVYYIVFSLHSLLHKDIINRTMRVEEKTVVTKTKEKGE